MTRSGSECDQIPALMLDMCRKARQSALALAQTPAELKTKALTVAAKRLRERRTDILNANEKDMAFGTEKGLTDALLDRLHLSEQRLDSIAAALEDVAAFPDPVGRELDRWSRPNGLDIAKISVPLGVIGIIYESRPNVTADAAALALKSGNAAILRGGSESLNSARAIFACVRDGIVEAGLPEHGVQLVPTRDRRAVTEMLQAVDYIDVIVPRGGRGLIERITEQSKIPLFKHLEGLCHTYIHKEADPKMAADVVANAKMRRTGICGATETVLIDQAALGSHLPGIVAALGEKNCEIRGDAAVVAQEPRVKPATEQDWRTEYLDAVVAVKTVTGVDEAVAHVNAYGSHHTDAIITDNDQAAAAFLNGVDSGIVMHNTSTQFADGGEFGLGAEIGISTGKMHARGPVGAAQLTTYKYVVRGTGQIRP